MPVCENCNVDHEQEALNDAENYAHLEKAWDAIIDAGNDTEHKTEFLPPHVRRFVRMINHTNREALMSIVMDEGPQRGFESYVEMMMEVSFCLGNSVRARYPAVSYEVSEEDVQQQRQQLEEAIARHHEDPLQNLRGMLEQMGIPPENVQIVNMEEVMDGKTPSASAPVAPDDDEKPAPGMYL